MKTCPKNHENPDNAKFCRFCGQPLDDESEEGNVVIQTTSEMFDNRPFYVRFPEFHLKPRSEYPELSFFNPPDYIEDPSKSSMQEYLWIVKDGKFGILYWKRRAIRFFDDYYRIIKCRYDRIIKHDMMFECHLGNSITYIDLKGNILR